MELNTQQLLKAYRKMREIREFEERLHTENTSGDIPGFIHLYTGEELSPSVSARTYSRRITSAPPTAGTATASPKGAISTR